MGYWIKIRRELIQKAVIRYDWNVVNCVLLLHENSQSFNSTNNGVLVLESKILLFCSFLFYLF